MGKIGSAIAGTAVGWLTGGTVGAVAGAIGGYTSGQASQQAGKYQRATSDYYSQMLQLSKEQLEWNRQLYQRWQSIFGDIEEGLSKFYGSLTPEVFAIQNIEAVQQEMQRALSNIRQVFAQRGLSDSGLEAKAEQQAMFQGAMAEAQIKANAPLRLAQERMRFLALGMNQGAQAVASMNQAYGTGMGALQTGMNYGMNMFNTYNNMSAQGWAGLGAYLGQLQASNAYNQALQNMMIQQYIYNPTPMYYTSLGAPVYNSLAFGGGQW